MKLRWQKAAARIDVLTLRQRALLFLACAAVLVAALYQLALLPLLREQSALQAGIADQRRVLQTLDADMSARADAFARDPDAADRTRLAAVRADSARLAAGLAALQQGLVAPERMTPLLQSILRANGKLALVSLTTLPVSQLGGPQADADVAKNPPKPGAAVPASGIIYRHGVQVTVRGNYLDMIDYMAALEALPTRLFWGQAAFEVDEYPQARLTLTLYTLSLDSKWMKL